jgi:hypothetical protein
MPFDGGENPDWWDGDGDEPPRETITHIHPTLPFIKIDQTRYINASPADQKFEEWTFCVWGYDGAMGDDNTLYHRGDATEQEMIGTLSERAERNLLDERGPFFVLRSYLGTGEYRKEIDAVMKKNGQSPFWRRAEAAVTRRLGVERSAVRMRYRLRGERPGF